MTIIEERESTQVLPPRHAPTEDEAQRKPARIEPPPTSGPRPIRWLPWLAGIIVVVAMATVVAALLTRGDDAAESPAATDLTAPALSAIDPHQSPEILRTLVTIPTAPSLADIDPRISPEVFVTATATGAPTGPSMADIDPHISPEVFAGR